MNNPYKGKVQAKFRCPARIKMKHGKRAGRCLRMAGHNGPCAYDLTGLRFPYCYVQKETIYVSPAGQRRRAWIIRDNKGRLRAPIGTRTILAGQLKWTNAPSGDGCITPSGYRAVQVAGKKILEHRYVMEQIIGRPLTKDETVHHGPKGRACNDPDNLSIRLKGNHPAGHSEQELANWLCSLGWRVKPPTRLLQRNK